VIQNLPPAVYINEENPGQMIYTFNVQAAMQFVGFESITMIASDPRHRTILGRKP